MVICLGPGRTLYAGYARQLSTAMMIGAVFMVGAAVIAVMLWLIMTAVH